MVSSDIRSLARESSESVGQIKATVTGILDQIATLRRDIEQVLGSAEIEVQTNRAIIAALEKLDDDIAALQSARNLAIRPGLLDGDPRRGRDADPPAGRAPDRRRRGGSRRRRRAEAATAASQQSRAAEDPAAAIEEIAPWPTN